MTDTTPYECELCRQPIEDGHDLTCHTCGKTLCDCCATICDICLGYQCPEHIASHTPQSEPVCAQCDSAAG